MGKLAKPESTGQPSAVEQVARVAFSEDMGSAVADTFRVPAKRRQDFQIAYALLPLNRARECIDMAYCLAGADAASDIELWVKSYERLARTVLPGWAKKTNRDYLRQTYNALKNESRSGLEYVLYQFKGFIYGVFCRALMERYSEKERSK
ncbi:MAG TPA: hypothetical protein DIT43_04445 [Dehalococcoidia bacterium]|nr:hypothetical protein [Dehalococcoidia bacterium]